jgi:predicted aspartyl protease
MITGAVKSDEARIRVKVRGRRGREQEVEAVIDSGYTGALTLPPGFDHDIGPALAKRGTRYTGRRQYVYFPSVRGQSDLGRQGTHHPGG